MSILTLFGFMKVSLGMLYLIVGMDYFCVTALAGMVDSDCQHIVKAEFERILGDECLPRDSTPLKQFTEISSKLVKFSSAFHPGLKESCPQFNVLYRKLGSVTYSSPTEIVNKISESDILKESYNLFSDMERTAELKYPEDKINRCAFLFTSILDHLRSQNEETRTYRFLYNYETESCDILDTNISAHMAICDGSHTPCIELAKSEAFSTILGNDAFDFDWRVNCLNNVLANVVPGVFDSNSKCIKQKSTVQAVKSSIHDCAIKASSYRFATYDKTNEMCTFYNNGSACLLVEENQYFISPTAIIDDTERIQLKACRQFTSGCGHCSTLETCFEGSEGEDDFFCVCQEGWARTLENTCTKLVSENSVHVNEQKRQSSSTKSDANASLVVVLIGISIPLVLISIWVIYVFMRQRQQRRHLQNEATV